MLEQAGEQIAELKKQLLELLAIKVAEIKLKILSKVFVAVAILLGVTFLAGLIGAAAFFIVGGTAEALAAALQSRGLGFLLAGVAALLVVGVGLLVTKLVLTRSSVKKSKPEADDESR